MADMRSEVFEAFRSIDIPDDKALKRPERWPGGMTT
jgi:hypothetical protein